MPLAHSKQQIDCSAQELWSLMLDKIRRPEKYVPGVQSARIVQGFGAHSVEREMTVKDGHGEKVVRELISADEATMSVMFKLLNDPDYTGYVLNIIFEEDGVVELEYLLHWTQKEPGETIASPDFDAAVKAAVDHAKALAERSAD